MATSAELRGRPAERSGVQDTRIDREFETRAKRVFGQFGDPTQKALDDAKMMWLAWRGDDRFVQARLGDQTGNESSWRFCEYKDAEFLIERFGLVEIRPMRRPFADHVLAFLSVLLQRKVAERRGAVVYAVPSEAPMQGTMRVEAKIEEAYIRAKDGFEVIADWPREPGGVLKSRSISLSKDQFLFTEFVRANGGRQPRSHGFVYMLSSKERASARLRKRDLIRWILYD